jgi:hypothetical protein
MVIAFYDLAILSRLNLLIGFSVRAKGCNVRMNTLFLALERDHLWQH